jgi:hypothetical protein
MTHGSLKSLTIKSLRGSVLPFTLQFEKGKKLTIIYGENGTGKSSICDAFDFLGKGNVGSLDGKGLGRTYRYWYSLGSSPADISVVLECNNNTFTATLSKDSVFVEPLFDAPPKVEVLRRSQILKLVEAKPSERYAAISQFIDVTGIEASEATLRKVVREIEKSVEVAVARVQENLDTVRSFWSEAGSSDGSATSWAEKEVGKDRQQVSMEKALIDKLLQAFNKTVIKISEFNNKSQELESKNQEVRNEEELISALNDQLSGEFEEVLDLLVAAQRHFVNHPNQSVCPLCESDENILGLRGKIDARIGSLHTSQEIRSARERLALKNQDRELIQKQLTQSKLTVSDLIQNSLDEIKEASLLKGIDFSIITEFLNSTEIWNVENDSQFKGLAKLKAFQDQYVSREKQFNTLKTAFETLQNNSGIKTELDLVLPHLKKMLNAVEFERKKFTDEVLHRIAVNVGELYEMVHPGEGMNKISLELDPVKRASLEIAAEFRGANKTPPQAYFSDSHLDTLGLCVFLALAKMDDPQNTILVLDDVLGSVDEPHVDRLIEMLFGEASNFKHCIITTHYRPWKQKLRWGWLKNGQCQFVELNKWSLLKGISITKSIPDVDKLRELLNADSPDPQLICSKAGVILEAALDFLTIIYQCHVPRRNESVYTLGDLLPSIDKKLKNALRVEHLQKNEDGSSSYIEKQLAPHLDEISRIAQARNIFGCHFNAISFDFLDSDAIRFGSEVLALMDCLVDHEIGWPKSDKSGSYWATTGETRRLHPLIKPS